MFYACTCTRVWQVDVASSATDKGLRALVRGGAKACECGEESGGGGGGARGMRLTLLHAGRIGAGLEAELGQLRVGSCLQLEVAHRA